MFELTITAAPFSTYAALLGSTSASTGASFTGITDTLRSKEEFHFDKMLADTFLDNTFDPALNTFQSIRRVADIYEWGNNVLLPGLFANAGPCAARVGATGAFASATDRPTALICGKATAGFALWRNLASWLCGTRGTRLTLIIVERPSGRGARTRGTGRAPGRRRPRRANGARRRQARVTRGWSKASRGRSCLKLASR